MRDAINVAYTVSRAASPVRACEGPKERETNDDKVFQHVEVIQRRHHCLRHWPLRQPACVALGCKSGPSKITHTGCHTYAVHSRRTCLHPDPESELRCVGCCAGLWRPVTHGTGQQVM